MSFVHVPRRDLGHRCLFAVDTNSQTRENVEAEHKRVIGVPSERIAAVMGMGWCFRLGITTVYTQGGGCMV